MRFLFCLLLLFCANNVIAEDVFQAADKSVLYVYVELVPKKVYASGTAFVVAPEIIATNHHVIEGGVRMIAITPNKTGDGKVYRFEVIWDSPGSDLALLKVSGLSMQPLAISEFPVRKGMKVTAIGFPGAADKLTSLEEYQGVESTLTEGVVGRVIDIPIKTGAPSVNMIQHSAPINHGNSGGPLFDVCGRVIGINDQKPSSGAVYKDRDGAYKVSQTDGIFWSIGVSSLVNGLKASNIAFTPANGDCIGGQALDGSSKAGLTSWLSVVGIFGALILAAGALFLSLRKREVIRETFTQFQRRKPAAGSDSINPTLSTSATYSWALNGSDSSGRKIRLALTGTSLAKGKVFLGRDTASCDLVIDDPSVSRRHASLELIGGQLRVTDLGSTNGTWVDREKVVMPVTPLRFGQVITIGKVSLKIEGA